MKIWESPYLPKELRDTARPTVSDEALEQSHPQLVNQFAIDRLTKTERALDDAEKEHLHSLERIAAQAAAPLVEKGAAFTHGGKAGRMKAGTAYLLDLAARHTDMPQKQLYDIAVREAATGEYRTKDGETEKVPFNADLVDGSLWDGDKAVDLNSFIKRVSKAINRRKA